MLKKYLILILCLGLFIATGCAQEKPEDTGKKSEPPKENIVMKDFRALSQENAKVDEVAQFIGANISQVSKEEASEMVIKLEKLQKEELPQFEALLNKEGMQQKFSQEYINIKSDPSKIKTADVKELVLKVQKSGYRIETAEGYFFPIIDYQFYTKYQTYVTDDIRDYIGLMAVESSKVPAKDAGLMIGWDEVLKRAATQEKFINQYPSSEKIKEVKALYKNYVSFTLYGTNNTPLFSYDNKKMVPQAKLAYRAATKEIGNSTYLKMVADYLTIIENHNDTLTKAVEQYRDQVSKEIK